MPGEMRRSLPVVFRVTFVRHGETASNRQHRIQGSLDIPLNSCGEKQASLAGQVVCKHIFTRAYSSDLRRAHRTCELILKQNTSKVPSIVEDTRLRERNFGSIENLHIDEVRAMAAADGLTWPNWAPPGAEGAGEVQARVVSFFKELCQSVYDKNKISEEDSSELEELEDSDDTLLLEESSSVEHVLIVSHGIALKQLYIHLHKTLGCPMLDDADALNRISPNTGLSEYLIRYSPKKYKLQCVQFHNGEHLKDLDEDS